MKKNYTIKQEKRERYLNTYSQRDEVNEESLKIENGRFENVKWKLRRVEEKRRQNRM